MKREPILDRLARLEAERFNVDYLKHDPKKAYREKLAAERERTLAIIRTQTERRKKGALGTLTPQQVFDAGRFAAGARDREAINAHRAVRDARKAK